MSLTALQKKNIEASLLALQREKDILDKYLKLGCVTLGDALATNRFQQEEIKKDA
jgi:hypothetical protein